MRAGNSRSRELHRIGRECVQVSGAEVARRILELATRELAEFFPAVLEAKLVKATVIKEIYATYAILPGLDKYRPMAKHSGHAFSWLATGRRPAGRHHGRAVRSGILRPKR